ncbi:MAG: 3-deoxy-D-manno-octulosonic acid transferase [Rhodobacteraceae bacterium]|nr:3-deoxy-D-manno-octulosonic acid transferase [Paracoccaceae bacterium]
MLFYRILLTLLTPAIAVWLLARRLRGRETARGMAERLGGGTGTRPDGPLLWLHGASNGELTSVRWMVEAMVQRCPDLGLIVTCNTETARALVEGWGMAQVTARMAPLDARWAVARFIGRWRPDALLMLENELWPNRILMMAARKRPVLVFGARMSEGSAKAWARLPALCEAMFGALAFVSAQDEMSRTRLRGLGVRPGRLGPVTSLKARGPAPGAVAPLPDTLRHAFTPSATLLAASTHPGEDRAVLEGFARARAAGHVARLILAPRHPRRRAEIEALIRAAGLDFATRSAGADPGAAPVYLADTMGEMDVWYRLAGVTFVGGSLVPAGGHTPYEPARFGSAILHGPYVANFIAVYRALDRAGGARVVADAAGIAAALADLSDAARRAQMAAAAREALEGAPGGGEDALFAALAKALDRPALRT